MKLQIQTIKDPMEDPIQVLIITCSDCTRPRRKVAWLLQFTQLIKDRGRVQTGVLTVDFNAATVAIAKIGEGSGYAQEIKDLKSNGVIKASRKIA